MDIKGLVIHGLKESKPQAKESDIKLIESIFKKETHIIPNRKERRRLEALARRDKQNKP